VPAPPGSPYAAGSTGFDISWPQCGYTYPSPDGLLVVGVTNGRVFTQNPCLTDEWQSARPVAGATIVSSVYVNTGAPVPQSQAYSLGANGPDGACQPTDMRCWSYNYGYNAALDAYGYATDQGVDATMWWLDVELANSWLADTNANFAVIQGMTDALVGQGMTVGVYSTGYQWQTLMGANQLSGVPIWIAGASDPTDGMSRCTNPHAWFAGGTPWLVQYPRPPYDGDIAC
jgi:hypothetical protein